MEKNVKGNSSDWTIDVLPLVGSNSDTSHPKMQKPTMQPKFKPGTSRMQLTWATATAILFGFNYFHYICAVQS